MNVEYRISWQFFPVNCTFLSREEFADEDARDPLPQAVPGMSVLLLTAVITGAASTLLTGLVRAYAIRHELLDRPNDRSSHTTPTPHGGGVAVILTSVIAMAVGVSANIVDGRQALTLGVGMVVLATIGWIDDTKGSLPGIRLAIQLAGGWWTLYMFGGLPAIRLGTTTYQIGYAGYVLGLLGVVWSINLYNFMDGIDGFAGSQAVIIFGTVSILSIARGNSSIGAIAAIFAAAVMGFLLWNWPPAKIFLGDVGSGAIGYLVCGLAIASENRQSVPLFVFAILGLVFIADSTSTLVRRFRRGSRTIEAHRDHAYQRLARLFGSHEPVTVAAAAATSVLAVLATLATVAPRFVPALFIVACVFVGFLLYATEKRAPLGNS
jgi:Fuc2NAc and GlcNAc transferase